MKLKNARDKYDPDDDTSDFDDEFLDDSDETEEIYFDEY